MMNCINKGKSWEEIHGIEKAKLFKNNLSKILSDKTHKLLDKQCQHCLLKGKGPNMTRYHFDNCKLINSNK